MPGNLLGSVLIFIKPTRSYHVRHEKGTLDNEILVEHSLHDSAIDKFGGACALFDGVNSCSTIVVIIISDLKLNNGHKTVVLADRTITGESVSGLINSLQAW